jgi:hypothetical protein
MHLDILIIFLNGRGKKFTFCHYIDNFSPWEDIVRKKVLKLRSIAKLRAFDGSTGALHGRSSRSTGSQEFIGLEL